MNEMSRRCRIGFVAGVLHNATCIQNAVLVLLPTDDCYSGVRRLISS